MLHFKLDLKLTGIGATAVLTALARDAGAMPIANMTFTWSSSATSVVTVTSTGLVTAVGAGNATITAVAAGVSSNTVAFTVVPAGTPIVSRIDLRPSEPVTLTTVGATYDLSATAFDSSGAAVSGAAFTWTSSSVAVATVANGRVTAISAGQAIIRARVGNTISNPVFVTVTLPAIALDFSRQPTNITRGIAINPAVLVRVLSSTGQVATSYSGTISLALGGSPGVAAITGTATVMAVAGLATFSNVSVSAAGPGYSLVATAASLAGATSATFDVFDPPAPATQHKAWVLNGSPRTVSAISSQTNTVTSVAGLTHAPFMGAATANGASLYISTWGNTLAVITRTTGALATTIDVGMGPGHVQVSPNGAWVYLANSAFHSVSVVSAATHTVTTTVPDVFNPGHLRFTPNSELAFVATVYEEIPGVITAISTAGHAKVATAPIGVRAQRVIVAPDGSRVYAVSAGRINAAGSVTVIATTNNTVLATIDVGHTALDVVVTPNGQRLFVADGRGLTVIAAATNTVVATVPLPGTSRLALTPDGATLYALHAFDGYLSVVSASDQRVVTTITVGTIPQDMAISPDGSRLYVVCSDAVYVIATTTNTVMAKVSPGANAGGLVITP